jgi:DNA-binding NarL/FixJ family response regulator
LGGLTSIAHIALASVDREVPRLQASLYIVSPHSIFRLGLTTCLEMLALVRSVGGAATVADGRRDPRLGGADVVIVDVAADDAHALIRDARDTFGARVVAIGSAWDGDAALAAVEAGAVALVRNETLTPESLEATVRSTLAGAMVLPPELIGGLIGAGGAEEGSGPPSRLTTREEQVLRLIADGHATREVAAELCYSERTVKNVLHDAVTKLGARSRSHAVAHAVRMGLI